MFPELVRKPFGAVCGRNVWPSDYMSFMKWVSVLKGVLGSSSVVLHYSRSILGETNIAFVQLEKQKQSELNAFDAEIYAANEPLMIALKAVTGSSGKLSLVSSWTS
jgi:hypothetical protein